MSKESSRASPSPSKNGGPSASAGGAAAELGVIVPYPEEAIARRSFEPVAVPVHPLVRRARSLAAGMLPTMVMIAVLLAFWQLLCGSPDATFPSPLKVWRSEERRVGKEWVGRGRSWWSP